MPKKNKNVHMILCRRPDSEALSFWPPKIYHDRVTAIAEFEKIYFQSCDFKPCINEGYCPKTGQLLFFTTSAGFHWHLYLDLEPND